MRRHSIALATILLLSGASGPHAQWVAGGKVIPAAGSNFAPMIASDGAHGSFVLTDRITHLDPEGHVIGGGLGSYAPGSLTYNVLGTTYQRQIQIASDGQGGVYLARTKYNNGADTPGGAIRIHHLGPDLRLDATWPAGGYELAPVSTLAQTVYLTPDPSGDVYANWSAGSAIGVQRLTRVGVPTAGWPLGGGIVLAHPRAEVAPGVPVKTPTGVFQPFLSFTPTWHSVDGSCCIYGPDSLLFLMGGVGANGATPAAWSDLVRETGSDFRRFTLTDDGATGFYTSSSSGPLHFLADLSVDPAWPGAEFVSAIPSPGSARYLEPVADGAGGCFVPLFFGDGAYLTRIAADGHPAPGWNARGSAGIYVSEPTGGSIPTKDAVIPDREGGAYLLGFGLVTNPPRLGLYAQHVTAQGVRAPGWPLLGRVQATMNTKLGYGAVSDEMGGVVVMWMGQVGSVTTVRALGFNASGDITTGIDSVPAISVCMLSALPSPSSGATTLRFSLSRASNVALDVVDVAGRLVRHFAPGIQSAGAHSVVWDGRDEVGRRVAPGVYLARAALDGAVSTARVVRLR